jgi:hypothetical protein
MTKEELAAQLTGHEYGQEISKALEAEAKVAGLVVVFGYSDDNVEMRGAWRSEYSAWGGTELLITAEGIWDKDACAVQCIYFRSAYQEARKHGQLVHALWDQGGYSWLFQTTIPHATFEIVEAGKKYCRGIVFAIADLRTDQGDTKMDPPWKRYRRTGLSEMRPYIPGESLIFISLSAADIPEFGGMVARNPQNHEDQWYVSKQYFLDNLEPVEEAEGASGA